MLIHFNDVGGEGGPGCTAPEAARRTAQGSGIPPLGQAGEPVPGHRAAGMNIEFLVTGSEYA